MLDFSYINTNPFLPGIAILMLNMGSRYVISDLGEFHQKVLSSEIVKKFIIFCMFFVATRDTMVSLILTIVFSIVVYGIFNEKSRYSLIQSDNTVKGRLKEYYENVK